jgi:eukaryotic translation initiation factor 2C
MEGTPSLAAVVASVDSDFVQFPASMKLQASKEEMIQDFTEMMIDRLLLYQARNKALPERVFLFRDGVSEGQFDKVLVDELPQIQKAFEKVYTGKDGKPSKRPDLKETPRTIFPCGRSKCHQEREHKAGYRC